MQQQQLPPTSPLQVVVMMVVQAMQAQVVTTPSTR